MIDTHESMTAKLCQFARAYHSTFERDKIFDDHLAFDLMGIDQYHEVGQLIANDFEIDDYDPNAGFRASSVRHALNKYISPIPLSRIAFSEWEIKKFSQKHEKCQYVICGAGLDTFAFRNTDPGISIFEIDHPDTQRYKLERIKKLEWIIPENVSYVPVDFSKDDMADKLIENGFDKNIPTMFSIPGVTYYLTLNVFEDTVSKISSISPLESRIVFDFPDETTFSENVGSRVRTLSEITAKLGEPMLHGYVPSEVIVLLEKYGFLTDIHKTPQRIQQIFFDNRKDNQKAFENIHFISAEKTMEVNNNG